MPNPTQLEQLVLFTEFQRTQQSQHDQKQNTQKQNTQKQNNITFQFFQIHVNFVTQYLRQFLQLSDSELRDIAKSIVTDIYYENRQLKQIQLSLLNKILTRKKHFYEHYFFETSFES